ncbi:MAG: hypothetical protein J2P37_27135 [Ktedonobacteraceae bacterium]|jgi:hypothetical protein|nr:hypothetical protein [Ktedonobacteraceae bacterium]
MDGAPARETKRPPLWRRWLTPGLLLRVIVALLISGVIVMAFFATSAVSN